ncbi:MAG TPA: MerR family transcriptional regulator [Acidimicrobiales bacterium]
MADSPDRTSDRGMTIDELAHRAGATSRNIRAYQERGILPPPKVVGRTGYYDAGHLARLRHIAQLLERGFSLAAIRELFDAWQRGHGLADVLRFEQALDAPWEPEPTGVLTVAELEKAFGADDHALTTALELGIIELDGDHFRVRSPKLFAVGARLVAEGVPVSVLLAEVTELRDDADRIAARWVDLFADHLLAGYLDRGMPEGELQGLADLLRDLRPLAGLAVAPLLGQAMDRRMAELSADTLANISERKA